MSRPPRALFATLLAGLIAGALVSPPAAAAGDAERGALLAETCLGCHGIPGYRNAYPSFRVPKLGGQKEEYLVIALQGYREDMRAHQTMQAQAASLSDQDMRDIAAFIAGQGEPETGELVEGGGQVSRGREKAAVCSACHGEAGVSPAPNWPNLAGQYPSYLEHSIAQYRSGERKDAVMMGQASNLSDQDIADLAAFYAAQSGLYTADYGD